MFDSDKELIEACLKKDVAAEKQLYHRFAPVVFGICLRFGGNEMEARDILQNGFLRLFHNLHKFRFEGSLEGWVKRIFVRVAINYHEQNLKHSRMIGLDERIEEVTVDEDTLSAISARELLKVIQTLPVTYRAVFNLYVMEDYEHSEIAAMLGISESLSKLQLHRAKKMIREILGKGSL